MSLSGVNSSLDLITRLANDPGLARQAASAGNGGQFEQLLKGLVNEVNQQQAASDESVRQLSMGETDDVHGVVLSAIKANLSVQMLFEVRNQVIDAYQEVMRMQL